MVGRMDWIREIKTAGTVTRRQQVQGLGDGSAAKALAA